MEGFAEAIFSGLVVGILALVLGIIIVAVKKGAELGEKGLKKGAELGEKGLKKARNIVEEVQNTSKSAKQKIIEMDEKKFLIAQEEIDQKNPIKSLWIKAKVLSEGNKETREIEYIKLRVNQLTKEEIL